MKTPQVLPLVKSFVARLFSLRSSQLENTTYLSPPNHPPALVVEVMVVGSTPIQAGGYTDTWGATLNGRDIILESYRFYEIGGDIECTSRRYHTEISAYTQLSHPNIVPFVGITSLTNHPFSLVFDTAGYLGLREYLSKNPGTDKLKLVQGIARGLKHVHDLDIVHGRLCPKNILIGLDGVPHITGFGCSLLISRPDLWSEKDVLGFHRGIAPELIRPPKLRKPVIQISKASDMYAFGMLTWEIFSEKYPFSGDLDPTVVCRVSRGDRPSRPDHSEMSNRVWNMVKACWRDSPSRRMGVWEVVAILDAE